jgi:hypothetical protein
LPALGLFGAALGGVRASIFAVVEKRRVVCVVEAGWRVKSPRRENIKDIVRFGGAKQAGRSQVVDQDINIQDNRIATMM